jgi:DNA end-binding protein Ku
MAEDEEVDQPAGIRSFWTGQISFGLVTVPVAIYTATRPRGTSLRMVAPDGATVERRYVCSKDEEPLDRDDIVRGFEIEKGKFVIVSDDELEAIEPRKSREIDLQLFVDRDTIDPIYFERGYFLVPTGGTNKAYRLLAEVMEKTNQAGIATFVMRAKEHLVAIISEKGILRAQTMRFDDEVRSPADVGLPKKVKALPADVKKFETQIARHAHKLSVKELVDDYEQRLEKLVKSKEKKREDIVKLPEDDRSEESGGDVVDLLEVLSRSLGGTAVRKPAKRSATAKRSSAKRK